MDDIAKVVIKAREEAGKDAGSLKKTDSELFRLMKDWEDTDARLEEKWKFFQRKIRIRHFLRIASAAIAVFIIGIAYFLYTKTTSPFSPNDNGVKLITGNGICYNISPEQTDTLCAAGGNILIEKGVLTHISEHRPPRRPDTNLLVIPPGMSWSLRLEDGSIIRMNAGSELEYPEFFPDTAREVKLSGEAYFEIAPDKKRPFIIHTDYFDIDVTGTRFAVNTHGDTGQAFAALEEGRIALHTKGGNTVNMQPKELVAVNTSTLELSETTVSYEEIIGWTSGIFRFRNSPLSFIIKQLERHYKISFDISEIRTEEYYTGDIGHEVPVDNLLRIIEKNSRYKFKKTKKNIYKVMDSTK